MYFHKATWKKFPVSHLCPHLFWNLPPHQKFFFKLKFIFIEIGLILSSVFTTRSYFNSVLHSKAGHQRPIIRRRDFWDLRDIFNNNIPLKMKVLNTFMLWRMAYPSEAPCIAGVQCQDSSSQQFLSLTGWYEHGIAEYYAVSDMMNEHYCFISSSPPTQGQTEFSYHLYSSIS
jgi:hypothetical protein